MFPKRIPLFAFALCLLWGAFGSLQAQTEPFPALMIKEQERSTPLQLDELKINVEVVGAIATTTMEMSFYNPNDRVLEGQLMFPLGEGQTVSRFALEVNGKMREGVVVEREKGRVAYETTVRRGIDPGLVEWSKGQNFKTRVYPIPAKGHKRLIVAYEQELKSLDKGNLYLLPLNFRERVNSFSLKVEVFKQKIAPQFEQNELANLAFNQWQENYVAEMKEANYLPNKQLGFVLPRPQDFQQIFVERDAQQKAWFYFQIKPPVISRPRKLPEDVTLLWDISGSAASRDLKKEFALLDKYFAAIGNAKVHLISFAHAADNEQIFYVSNGNWDLLKSSLNKLDFDGGTSFGALNLQGRQTDEFILCSDGISNFGQTQLKPVKAPVTVINSAQNAEHSYLNFIASASGGRYLNLNRLTTEEAYAALMQSTYQFLGARFNSGEITDVYPSIPQAVYGDFSLAGRLKTGSAQITLNFGIGGEILHSERVSLDLARHASETGKVKRLWAQKKLSELLLNPKQYEEQITQLGKEHTIVTPNTSLIVLDRLEDYIEFEIVPPAEMQADYFAALRKEKEEKETARTSRIETVVEIWNARIEYWKKDYPMDTPKLLDSKSDDGGWGDASSDDWGGDDFGESESYSEEFAEPAELNLELQETQNARLDPVQDEAGKRNGDGKPKPLEGSIEINNWDPNEPYLTILKETPVAARYGKYLELKPEYGSGPSFFLDVSDFFRKQGEAGLAMRVLSNLAEMELDNYRVLRVMAHRLVQLNQPELAALTFEEVKILRPEEPQSYRDLGLAYARAGNNQLAIDYLYEVVTNQWDERFDGIELICLEELNAIVGTSHRPLKLDRIDPRFIKNLTSEVRVVLDWDADNCDMDLWVIDPNGEKCFYSHPTTYMGGYLTNDMTGGYGPEAFMLKMAKAGTYTVKVKYYADYQQSLVGPTTLHLSFFTRFGQRDMKLNEVTLRLAEGSEVLEIGKFEFK